MVDFHKSGGIDLCCSQTVVNMNINQEKMGMEFKGAIEYLSEENLKRIPTGVIEAIRENGDEAAEFFLSILDKLTDTIEDSPYPVRGSTIEFLAPFFLADIGEKRTCRKIYKLLQLYEDDLELWLGDAQTENLPHIIYAVFDGDTDVLADIVTNPAISEYTRSAIMDVFTALLLNGTLSGEEFDSIMSDFMELKESDEVIASSAAMDAAQMHRKGLLTLIRSLYEEGFEDRWSAGSLSEIIEYMYGYSREKPLIRIPFSLEKEIGYWYPVGDEEKSAVRRMEEAIPQKRSEFYEEIREFLVGKENWDVGRNDPCPCGSGMKFKKCCLPKIEEAKTKKRVYESPARIAHMMRYYPALSFDPLTGLENKDFERMEGRLYLEDDYDRDAITIDYLVCLGLHPRAGRLTANLSHKKEEEDCIRQYLAEAYELLKKIMYEKGLKDISEFDEEYAISSFAEEWLDRLHTVCLDYSDIDESAADMAEEILEMIRKD